MDPNLQNRHSTVNARAFDFYLGYLLTIFGYNETVDNGATTNAYTKESTGIQTGMVHVTVPFDNVISTQNGMRVEYPDGNKDQSTHYALLILPFLPVEMRSFDLF